MVGLAAPLAVPAAFMETAVMVAVIGGFLALVGTVVGAVISARKSPYEALSERVVALEQKVHELETDRARDRRWITSAIIWMAGAAEIIANHPGMPHIDPPPAPPRWHSPDGE